MITVIGIGPRRDDMTLRALKSLDDAEVVIGYGPYLRQIEDLIADKEIIVKGMGQELERAELAISKHREGKKVALVSSGDPGVYGMANVLYQILGKYAHVEVEVVPGVTSATYTAAVLGAPLHDFSVISLSNILTPLTEIKRKVQKAAEADMIIVFYNPRSKKRFKPLNEAFKILKNIKSPLTLIGIVKTTDDGVISKVVFLEDFNEEYIDMSTTILVGNSFTYLQDGRMVTSRGYVVPYSTHPLSIDFYESYIAGDGIEGQNLSCEYFPCHSSQQNCTFCYCPFYPCADSSTGGHWIKEKGVWSCEDCLWIHQDDTVECIQGKLGKLLEDVGDLQEKKKQLLKLRRECVYQTK